MKRSRKSLNSAMKILAMLVAALFTCQQVLWAAPSSFCSLRAVALAERGGQLALIFPVDIEEDIGARAAINGKRVIDRISRQRRRDVLKEWLIQLRGGEASVYDAIKFLSDPLLGFGEKGVFAYNTVYQDLEFLTGEGAAKKRLVKKEGDARRRNYYSYVPQEKKSKKKAPKKPATDPLLARVNRLKQNARNLRAELSRPWKNPSYVRNFGYGRKGKFTAWHFQASAAKEKRALQKKIASVEEEVRRLSQLIALNKAAADVTRVPVEKLVVDTPLGEMEAYRFSRCRQEEFFDSVGMQYDRMFPAEGPPAPINEKIDILFALVTEGLAAYMARDAGLPPLTNIIKFIQEKVMPGEKDAFGVSDKETRETILSRLEVCLKEGRQRTRHLALAYLSSEEGPLLKDVFRRTILAETADKGEQLWERVGDERLKAINNAVVETALATLDAEFASHRAVYQPASFDPVKLQEMVRSSLGFQAARSELSKNQDALRGLLNQLTADIEALYPGLNPAEEARAPEAKRRVPVKSHTILKQALYHMTQAAVVSIVFLGLSGSVNTGAGIPSQTISSRAPAENNLADTAAVVAPLSASAPKISQAAKAPVIAAPSKEKTSGFVYDHAGMHMYQKMDGGLWAVFSVKDGKAGSLVETRRGVVCGTDGVVTNEGELCERIGRAQYKGEEFIYREFVTTDHIKGEGLQSKVKGMVAVVSAKDTTTMLYCLNPGDVIIHPDGTVTNPAASGTTAVSENQTRLPTAVFGFENEESRILRREPNGDIIEFVSMPSDPKDPDSTPLFFVYELDSLTGEKLRVSATRVGTRVLDSKVVLAGDEGVILRVNRPLSDEEGVFLNEKLGRSDKYQESEFPVVDPSALAALPEEVRQAYIPLQGKKFISIVGSDKSVLRAHAETHRFSGRVQSAVPPGYAPQLCDYVIIKNGARRSEWWLGQDNKIMFSRHVFTDENGNAVASLRTAGGMVFMGYEFHRNGHIAKEEKWEAPRGIEVYGHDSWRMAGLRDGVTLKAELEYDEDGRLINSKAASAGATASARSYALNPPLAQVSRATGPGSWVPGISTAPRGANALSGRALPIGLRSPFEPIPEYALPLSLRSPHFSVSPGFVASYPTGRGSEQKTFFTGGSYNEAAPRGGALTRAPQVTEDMIGRVKEAAASSDILNEMSARYSASKKQLEYNFYRYIGLCLGEYETARAVSDEARQGRLWSGMADASRSYLRSARHLELENKAFLEGRLQEAETKGIGTYGGADFLNFIRSALRQSVCQIRMLDSLIEFNDKLIDRGIFYLPEAGRGIESAKGAFLLKPGYTGYSKSEAEDIAQAEFIPVINAMLSVEKELVLAEIDNLNEERRQLAYRVAGIDTEHASPEYLKSSGKLKEAEDIIKSHPKAVLYALDITVLEARLNALDKLSELLKATENRNIEGMFLAQKSLNEAVLAEQKLRIAQAQNSRAPDSQAATRRAGLRYSIMENLVGLGIPIGPLTHDTADEELQAAQDKAFQEELNEARSNLAKAMHQIEYIFGRIEQAEADYEAANDLLYNRMRQAREVESNRTPEQIAADYNQMIGEIDFQRRKTGLQLDYFSRPGSFTDMQERIYGFNNWLLEGERSRAQDGYWAHKRYLAQRLGHEALGGVAHAQRLVQEAADGAYHWKRALSRQIDIGLPGAAAVLNRLSARRAMEIGMRKTAPRLYVDLVNLIPLVVGRESPLAGEETARHLRNISADRRELTGLGGMPVRRLSHPSVEDALKLRPAAAGTLRAENGDKMEVMLSPQVLTAQDAVDNDQEILTGKFVEDETSGLWVLKEDIICRIGVLNGKKDEMFGQIVIPGVITSESGIVKVVWREGVNIINALPTLLGVYPKGNSKFLVAYTISKPVGEEIVPCVIAIALIDKVFALPQLTQADLEKGLKVLRFIHIGPDDTRENAQASGVFVRTNAKEIVFYFNPGNSRLGIRPSIDRIEKPLALEADESKPAKGLLEELLMEGAAAAPAQPVLFNIKEGVKAHKGNHSI